MRLIFTLLLSLLLLSPGAQAEVYNPDFFTLDNGLRVVVVNNPRTPVVTHMIWYQVGRRDEPYGQSGLAHFFEHQMFKGTKEIPDGQFSKIVTSLGGQNNAFTSQDYTAYYQSIAKEHLPQVMAMEADRMTNLILTPEIVELERPVILAERAQRTENNPFGVFWEDLTATAFINHPYSVPVIGWRHEIEQLSYDALKQFYQTWYAPNNAVVVLSGDITVEEAKTLTERVYGPIPSKPLPERTQYTLAHSATSKQVTKQSPQVFQAIWTKAYIAPSITPDNLIDPDSLMVAAEILGGGPTSRLYQELVVKKQSASAVSVSYDPYNIGPSTFSVTVTLRPEAVPADISKQVHEILQSFATEGPTDEELERAKRSLKIAAIYKQDSLQGPAFDIGQQLSVGMTLGAIEAWPERIESVSKKSINEIIPIVFNPEHHGGNMPVTGLLLPEKKESNQ